MMSFSVLWLLWLQQNACLRERCDFAPSAVFNSPVLASRVAPSYLSIANYDLLVPDWSETSRTPKADWVTLQHCASSRQPSSTVVSLYGQLRCFTKQII
ncbi:hypothetical protein RRG08_066020 [Elysia crispata]|uniref:Secreted protein n=1 Tax=Elysia crispata TaxID=231223 RepID=A0AAE0Z104_9GAST|nr:hypothetical protein RRG08_066020 [Elysia crispata]